MANSSTTPQAKQGYTPFFKADGTPFTRAERKAANKAKFAAEQAALRKAKADAKAKAKAAKSEPAAPAKTAKSDKSDRIHLDNLKDWVAEHPKRKTVSKVEIDDWMARSGNTKTGKRLARKGQIDSGLSRRNNKLEAQAQFKGGQLAAL